MVLFGTILSALGREEDVEYEQSIVRLVLGSIFLSYMFLSTPFAPWKLYILTGFSACSLVLVTHIHFYPGVYPARRIAGQFVDLISISLYLYFGGQSAAVAYCVYLWVIVGNGCRFGIAYMAICTVIACATFGFVALNEPYWQQHRDLALGLWITQIVVPGYLIGLLKRLTAATSRLEKLSRHDDLTGLQNRRSFNERANYEFERLHRDPSDFGFILVDIDHFKKINDQHGHQIGDIVLQNVAGLLADTCRDVDFVSRFGGEEFALLAPGSCKKYAQPLGERLRKTIEDATIVANGIPLKVTISIGVACWNKRLKALDDWVHQTDKALYQAKEEGRNRVIVVSHCD